MADRFGFYAASAHPQRRRTAATDEEAVVEEEEGEGREPNIVAARKLVATAMEMACPSAVIKKLLEQH